MILLPFFLLYCWCPTVRSQTELFITTIDFPALETNGSASTMTDSSASTTIEGLSQPSIETTSWDTLSIPSVLTLIPFRSTAIDHPSATFAFLSITPSSVSNSLPSTFLTKLSTPHPNPSEIRLLPKMNASISSGIPTNTATTGPEPLNEFGKIGISLSIPVGVISLIGFGYFLAWSRHRRWSERSRRNIQIAGNDCDTPSLANINEDGKFLPFHSSFPLSLDYYPNCVQRQNYIAEAPSYIAEAPGMHER